MAFIEVINRFLSDIIVINVLFLCELVAFAGDDDRSAQNDKRVGL
jgi:hypothetical protein